MNSFFSQPTIWRLPETVMTDSLQEMAFKNFWMLDVVFWQFEIPAIVLLPLILYTLAILGRWIWRGTAARLKVEENQC